ncbi:hypothetical protein [Fructilactobacillus fructivorans]|uniref:hypothetical protein n=1 Tax=Fructilactobacillus fructivorans TaxID=1614 RepID=UPI000704EF68|nr:hypothetical protein [Fructilactobacillus fructivorans]
MKTTKLASGIVMIVLGAIIIFQSMFAGVSNAFESNNSGSGTLGFFLAVVYIITGIVYICTRKAHSLAADIINFVLLAFMWILSISNASDYTDLIVWGWIALIIGAVFLVWHLILNHISKKHSQA